MEGIGRRGGRGRGGRRKGGDGEGFEGSGESELVAAVEVGGGFGEGGSGA